MPSTRVADRPLQSARFQLTSALGMLELRLENRMKLPRFLPLKPEFVHFHSFSWFCVVDIVGLDDLAGRSDFAEMY